MSNVTLTYTACGGNVQDPNHCVIHDVSIWWFDVSYCCDSRDWLPWNLSLVVTLTAPSMTISRGHELLADAHQSCYGQTSLVLWWCCLSSEIARYVAGLECSMRGTSVWFGRSPTSDDNLQLFTDSIANHSKGLMAVVTGYDDWIIVDESRLVTLSSDTDDLLTTGLCCDECQVLWVLPVW